MVQRAETEEEEEGREERGRVDVECGSIENRVLRVLYASVFAMRIINSLHTQRVNYIKSYVRHILATKTTGLVYIVSYKMQNIHTARISKRDGYAGVDDLEMIQRHKNKTRPSADGAPSPPPSYSMDGVFIPHSNNSMVCAADSCGNVMLFNIPQTPPCGDVYVGA